MSKVLWGPVGWSQWGREGLVSRLPLEATLNTIARQRCGMINGLRPFPAEFGFQFDLEAIQVAIKLNQCRCRWLKHPHRHLA